MIERALISVYDKSGLDEFAQGLIELGVEIVSSGGTSAYLEEMGIPVTRIEEITQVPELLGGRVKTLHPRIHAAILARRDQPEDVSALEQQEIRPIDLVCVNLYPFRETVARHGVREEDAVEVIDIGGPAMLRAAAKNFAHVAPVCRGPQYERVLEQLHENGATTPQIRRERVALDSLRQILVRGLERVGLGGAPLAMRGEQHIARMRDEEEYAGEQRRPEQTPRDVGQDPLAPRTPSPL